MKLNDKLITDNFTIGAAWSNKSDFKIKTPGTLTYNYSEAQINVEFIYPEFDFEFDDVFDVFYGLINHSTFITLFNTQVVNRKCTNGTIKYIKLIADSMIIDSKPIPSIDDFFVKEVDFSYTHMEKWFNINPWIGETDDDGNRNYHYQRPVLKTYELESIGAVLEEKVTPRRQSTGVGTIETKLSANPYYTLEMNEKISLKEFYKLIYKISLLFNIFLGKKLNIKILDFPSQKLDFAGNQLETKGRFYTLQQKGMRNAKQTIPPYSYQKISPNLGQYLNIFFDNYSNLKVIMQNFSVAYTGKNYVENLFLDASLNLEVLYREFFDEKDQMEDEVLKAIKLVEKSLETVDDALKNKVVSRLKSLNNTSLRKRILDLLRDVSSNLLSKIDLDGYKLNTGKGKRDFAETCANTRNFFTHGSSNHKLNPFSSSELIKVSKILNMISEYHSMTIIGLEEETINEAISRNNYYQYIMK